MQKKTLIKHYEHKIWLDFTPILKANPEKLVAVQMPLSRWKTTSEPFSTTEPTEITERGALVRILGKQVWMRI
jgi:hypothetical protein